jgi:hypothetical protein
MTHDETEQKESPISEEGAATPPPILEDMPKTAQGIAQALIDAGLKPAEIAKRAGNRFSTRTVYRWLKGDVEEPKQKGNLDAAIRLLRRIRRA